jgi:hypothetical protein
MRYNKMSVHEGFLTQVSPFDDINIMCYRNIDMFIPDY